MAKKDEAFLQKLLETFSVEADEHIRSISSGLLDLEKTDDANLRKEIIETIFRDAHSLKGAARAVNQSAIESLCQILESTFASMKRGELVPSVKIFDIFHRTVSGLEQMLALINSQEDAEQQSLGEQLKQQLAGVLSSKIATDNYKESKSQTVNHESVSTTVQAGDRRTQSGGTVRIATSKLDMLFRQVEEMLALKQAAEKHNNEFKNIRNMLCEWEKTLDITRDYLQKLKKIEKKNIKPGSDEPETVKKLDEMLAGEVKIQRAISNELDGFSALLAADRRTLIKMVDNLQDDAKKILMHPLSLTFEILPKTARDIARDQGKEVEVLINGENFELDRRIQEEIKDPLIHIIRNCVDHGIESPEVRRQLHKDTSGKITINVNQQVAGKIEIVISDDGSGIDPDKVLAAALKSGAITEDAARELGNDDITSMIFQSGISTSPIVTDLSGRGIGLAIVREKIERLGGAVSLENRPGQGTTFHITLPVTMAAFRGVVVRVRDRYFVLPTVNVERVIRIKKSLIKTVENREVIQTNGHSLSVVQMANALGMPVKKTDENNVDYLNITVLNSGGVQIAFVVDEIVNEQEVLLKGLGKQLVRARKYSGSTLLTSGILAPLINVSDLIQTGIDVASSIVKPQEISSAEIEIKSVLVADDSITARSLLKNILESAGYKVTTAVDGMEALTALKTEKFDLVVSDIEMPRMDGFDLTEKIRTDKKLEEIPVILVTALASREHREKGIDAGANAYIVKSDFDQTGLLETIRRFI